MTSPVRITAYCEDFLKSLDPITRETAAHGLRTFAMLALEAGFTQAEPVGLDTKIDILRNALFEVYRKTSDEHLRLTVRRALKLTGASPDCSACFGTGEIHGFSEDTLCSCTPEL